MMKKKRDKYRLFNCANSDPVTISKTFQQEPIKKAPQLMLGAEHKYCGDST